MEDNPGDAKLVAAHLSEGGCECSHMQVDNAEAMEKALYSAEWDLVISDFSMPDFNGKEALQVLKKTGYDIPFIIISGYIEEGTAVDIMRQGAHDYIMKDNLTRLLPAVERELKEARVRRDMEMARETLIRMNEELISSNKELKSLDEVKTNLLANVSHELRTPLVSIKGFTELMASGESGPVSPDQQHQLSIIGKNSERLLKLIDNLLDYTKMESGKLRSETSHTDFAEIISECLEEFLPRAEAAGAKIDFSKKTGNYGLSADREQIAQVIYNLLDNALKFTGKDGRIVIKLYNEGENAVCSICDNGIGIPASEQSKVFDQFFQVDSSSKRRFGGVGLGLAIVKNIVDSHGGAVRVESLPGKGSNFTVKFPGKTDKPLQGGLPRRQTAAGDVINVMVVDYHPEDSEYINALSETERFSVSYAGSRQEIFEILDMEDVDIIIIDDHVDIDSRLEIYSMLKSDTKTRHIPVIMPTADIIEAIENENPSGGRPQIKPFKAGELINALERMFSR